MSYSTVISYLSAIKRVRAKWGTIRIVQMKPMLIQAWLRELEAAPKTKGHMKAVMYRLYEKAMLREMVEWQRNSDGVCRNQGHQQAPEKTGDPHLRAVLFDPSSDSAAVAHDGAAEETGVSGRRGKG